MHSPSMGVDINVHNADRYGNPGQVAETGGELVRRGVSRRP